MIIRQITGLFNKNLATAPFCPADRFTPPSPTWLIVIIDFIFSFDILFFNTFL